MTPEKFARLKTLFEQALELSTDDRLAFIEKVRQEDEELGIELAALIKANEQETNSIGTPLLRFHGPVSGEIPAFSEGELVLDRFRIVRALGRGGMGEVYEATDLELGRVALKTIRPELVSQREVLYRFKQEVQLARKVTSPNVCRIYELFTVPGDGQRQPSAFLTMEFLDGTTLADRIAHEGALPFRDAEPIALQLCIALRAIHHAGVIHRDLKSSNVMLVPRNGEIQAVVMDLGLAREATPVADGGSGITVPGTVMGTPDYMAPEQFEGKPVSPATDIYALGVLLYEIVTGIRPFRGTTPIAAAIQRAKRPLPPSSTHSDLPHHWDEVIERCLKYESVSRYQSADEVAEALRCRPSQVKRAFADTSFGQRGAICLSVLLILAAVAWYESGGHPAPSPDAQHWYNEGVAALREGTYVKATQALGRATELNKDFVLAHARLADAWAELDFTGKAQEEMLRASALETRRKLPEIDRRYLNAVRATLTRDFQQAVEDYLAVLRALPNDDKAYGYVDLGRASEKASNISEALKCYAKGAELAPEYPASFVHLGILESRQGRHREADAAFTKAEALYHAASNNEGIAEIDYQRSYAASLRGDLPLARAYLEKSLRAARDIPSAQLEIRTLTRMSVVESSANNTPTAVELATRAVKLAREKGLDYWAIDGLIRLGTAYLDQNDYAKAEPPFQEALRLAQESGRPRLEASARLSLASIRDEQGKPDDAIPLAQAALDYYTKTGFVNESTSALIILIRAKQTKGDARGSLQLAFQALESAKKLNSPQSLLQVEESIGSAFLDLEEYPEALSHFQSALTASRNIDEDVEYQTLHCADVLWRLGRYVEAEQMLRSIPSEIVKRAVIATEIKRILASVRLSQRRYAAALALVKEALNGPIPLPPATAMEFQIIGGVVEAQSGNSKQAKALCQAALDTAQQETSPEMTATAKLCQATVFLLAGSVQQARDSAESARMFFTASGQKESEYRSLFHLSKIYILSGDSVMAKKSASQALDILSEFDHTWGDSIYQLYLRRPDIRAEWLELSSVLRK